MPRNIVFECNKLHGFLRMNNFTDKGIVPCVRSKIIDCNFEYNTIPDIYYTIKVVKENIACSQCENMECEICTNFSCLYDDYGLKIKKRILPQNFLSWVNKTKKEDPDSIFYYYPYFESELFGKLIICKDYYAIEIVDGDDTNLCLENNVIWRASGTINKMENLSDARIEELLGYASLIREKMRLYVESDYSIILDFAYTNNKSEYNNFYDNEKLLFYGMRSAYNKTNITYPYGLPLQVYPDD